MGTVDTLLGVSNASLGVMIFTMWYYENKKRENDTKKIDTLQAMVQQQMDEKSLLREERKQFVELLESHATLIGRTMGVLDRMDQRMVNVINKVVS